ncbi:F0F1 ATP synthase subunit alpha [Candidatus Daviesbacteria bacterium]|nr:F0F1 ATP synthase subunit alpha [Candidatus Daviesbacteria bacterium]
MKQTQQEVGYVISSKGFLIYLDGLPTVKVNDLVENESGGRGWVNSLSSDKVEVLMLDDVKVTPGQLFKRLPERLGIAAGDHLLGRAINPLGVPIDGRGLFSRTKKATVLELEQEAPGIGARQFITEQFTTNITIIDSLIPIGKGQRELIVGDAHAGKTAFLIDTIVNQKNTGTICIYASVGKPVASVRDLIDVLRANKALAHSIIIAASSNEPAPLIFLTPKTAFTLAEYFQKQGLDVLVILDDLGNHAKIYREISLLGDKSPGRESYPGDIFYQHAHLVERAGKFKKEYGGGSITALPVIELNLTDFTTFIPTNLMAMTDGHLLFRSSLHNIGQRPAIDISLSVSRVGRQTQNKLSSLLSSRIRGLLSQAEELETISRFSSELPFETQLILKRKELIEEIIKQPSLTYVVKEIQSILLALIFTGFMADKERHFLEKYKGVLIEAFLKEPSLLKITQSVSKLESVEELIKLLEGARPVLTKICQ